MLIEIIALVVAIIYQARVLFRAGKLLKEQKNSLDRYTALVSQQQALNKKMLTYLHEYQAFVARHYGKAVCQSIERGAALKDERSTGDDPFGIPKSYPEN